MQDARTCSSCFVVTNVDRCPKCGLATTRVFLSPEIILDQLIRHVIEHVANLGSKIEELTGEIRTQNKIESGKKQFSELKNKMMAELSRAFRAEGKENDDALSK